MMLPGITAMAGMTNAVDAAHYAASVSRNAAEETVAPPSVKQTKKAAKKAHRALEVRIAYLQGKRVALTDASDRLLAEITAVEQEWSEALKEQAPYEDAKSAETVVSGSVPQAASTDDLTDDLTDDQIDKVISVVMDNFDFDSVHEVMRRLNYQWQKKGAACLPTISDLKDTARSLLRRVIADGGRSCATGGFVAQRRDVLGGNRLFELLFVVQEAGAWSDGEPYY